MNTTSPLSSILVVGVNTRPIVKSAKALGLETIAVDYFYDIDLLSCADDVFSRRDPDLKSSSADLLELSIRALEVHDVDAILLTSGTEHDPKLVKKLSKRAEIIGNSAVHMKACENKEKLFHVADKLDIPHPLTKRVRTLNDALKTAEDIEYPVVLKPAFGGGGIGIRLARSPKELERFYRRVLHFGDGETSYVQQYIRGVNASASILSNGDEAKCLTVNEQVIGDKRLGVPRPFGYCGNVIPLDTKHDLASKIAEYSERICSEIGLVGSNGVDFVLSNEPYLMEVNPRFQNTIDCVEGLLRINLVEEHIRSCRGELGRYGGPNGCSAKLILYAKKNVKIPDLTRFMDIVDIPRKGSTVKRGRPICSVLKFGRVRRSLIADAYETANKLYGLFR